MGSIYGTGDGLHSWSPEENEDWGPRVWVYHFPNPVFVAALAAVLRLTGYNVDPDEPVNPWDPATTLITDCQPSVVEDLWEQTNRTVIHALHSGAGAVSCLPRIEVAPRVKEVVSR